MIVILKDGEHKEEIAELTQKLKEMKIEVHPTYGARQTILGLVGDTSQIDIESLRVLDFVAEVKRVSEPYKAASRSFHPDDTIVEIGGSKIGGGHRVIIAGPCSVESREQMIMVAKRVREAGATLMRGGAFKPRTSPYAFQGLHEEGIKILLEAKRETGMPIVTELMDLSHLKYFDEVDVIQIGARNMQNFELLRQVGRMNKPVLLKRGLSSTLQELLMSAEYILSGGNANIILCERGIRTFETATRNTLDLSAVPMLHEMTHLPIVVDPSHATGIARMVKPMALAAAACGADGLMIEVHNDPQHAKCDGPQSLTPDAFDDLTATLRSAAGWQ